VKKLFLVALASAVIATALRAWMRRSDDHGADPQPTGDDVQRWEDEGGAVADEEAQISVAL
jgi:hypothetical protein